MTNADGFEVSAVLSGGFPATAETVKDIGDRLEQQPGILDPVLVLDVERGEIEISVEITAGGKDEAAAWFLDAVEAVMTSLGATRVVHAQQEETVVRLVPA